MEDSIVDSEILHGGEGGDVERWLEPRNKSFYFRLIYCLLFIIHLFLSINAYLNKIAIEHLNSYIEDHEEKFGALHGESSFKSCFE